MVRRILAGVGIGTLALSTVFAGAAWAPKISRVEAEACKDGGYANRHDTDGRAFANQGQCVAAGGGSSVGSQ